MKRIVLALAIVALATAPATAQEAPQTPTLTAEGAGVVTAAPDIVIVTIGVTTRGARPAEALAANSADMRAVIDAVTAAGVAERDVATSGFSISPVYGAQRPGVETPAPIVAYEVTNQLTVRIRDLAASGAILDRVVAAGANQINGIRFDIAEPQPLEDEALRLAIADAKRKADLMAAAAGVRLVRVLSVSAYGAAQPAVYERAAFSIASTPIVGGERSITATATLLFEIAPR